MKAIVFGGSGFLGSHVADSLSEAGHEVTVFDIRQSQYLRSDQQMIVGDILNFEAVRDAVAGKDVVYNFAGIADIDEAHARPVDTVKINILGNTLVLDAARAAGIKRFVFASSVYVYSQSGSFYRNSKEACELLIESYSQVYGLDFTILRYGSLYGPRSDDKNWMHKALKQALLAKEIVREGDGEEVREYVHAKDAANASVSILSDEFKNEYVVIAGQQAMKIKDLLVMMKEIVGPDLEIRYIPATSALHYSMTPYSFNPRMGKKLISRTYIDLGQGIMEMLADIHRDNVSATISEGVIIEDEQDNK